MIGRANDPDQAEAVVQYRAAAPGYDAHMQRFERWQRMAVDRLRLRSDDTVIDVGCGTGLNFRWLEAEIGPEGRIVGIDLSPEMLVQARERVEAAGWNNVELIEAAVDQAHIHALADAALFSFTHDVLQTPAAVANVVRHLRPGARVSSVGAKFAPRWAWPVNLVVRRAARPFVTTFEGLDLPWRELERHLGKMESKSLALGGAYVAWGLVPDEDGDATTPPKSWDRQNAHARPSGSCSGAGIE